MKNLLTIKVESSLGIIFLIGLALFFIFFFFIIIKNFNSDIDVETLQASNIKRIKVVSVPERKLIDGWLEDNISVVIIPESESKYRYILKKYPDKPWTR
ncbi:MAG: hypothetical protein HYT63_01400 [Candidatus Yanofskybacteria bacterium]|nr:hypothetical protein [Candidatus Yanofskybacteria bacterium]